MAFWNIFEGSVHTTDHGGGVNIYEDLSSIVETKESHELCKPGDKVTLKSKDTDVEAEVEFAYSTGAIRARYQTGEKEDGTPIYKTTMTSNYKRLSPEQTPEASGSVEFTEFGRSLDLTTADAGYTIKVTSNAPAKTLPETAPATPRTTAQIFTSLSEKAKNLEELPLNEQIVFLLAPPPDLYR